MALCEFIEANRDRLIALARERNSFRSGVFSGKVGPDDGVAQFLSQLCETLRIEAAGGNTTAVEGHMDTAAQRHGSALERSGVPVAQVVHVYGDVCQVITSLALQRSEPFSTAEFATLNRCLDDAIAGAVTQYAKERDRAIRQAGSENLGVLAHELRRHIGIAALAFQAVQLGSVAPGGSTALVVEQSLSRLQQIVDRTLARARLTRHERHPERVGIPTLIEDIEVSAAIEASSAGVRLVIERGPLGVAVEADRLLLLSAVSVLLHDAFVRTPRGGTVELAVHADHARVRIEVADESPAAEGDKGAPGYALNFSRRAIRDDQGTVSRGSRPGGGLVSSVQLPRLPSG